MVSVLKKDLFSENVSAILILDFFFFFQTYLVDLNIMYFSFK